MISDGNILRLLYFLFYKFTIYFILFVKVFQHCKLKMAKTLGSLCRSTTVDMVYIYFIFFRFNSKFSRSFVGYPVYVGFLIVFKNHQKIFLFSFRFIFVLKRSLRVLNKEIVFENDPIVLNFQKTKEDRF